MLESFRYVYFFINLKEELKKLKFPKIFFIEMTQKRTARKFEHHSATQKQR